MSHIALVIPGVDRLGGAERQVLVLAKGLAQRGWAVTLIALSGDGGVARKDLEEVGVGFVGLRMRKGLADPRGWWRMHLWLREHRPDILHAHLPHAVFLARWSRLLAPAHALVDTSHTSRTGDSAQQLGYRCSNFLSDGSTMVSKSAARAWVAAGPIPAGNLLVLPNGIDTERWRPNAKVRERNRAELGLTDEFVWLAPGRLEAVKNHVMLLDAMALLPATTHLFIAGGGPLESALRERVLRFGLEKRVHFLGFVDDLLPWMQAADGAVLASRWEGLPLALLEAAACGLPAVATDVAGSRDVIVPGMTGYLCATGNVADMAAAMQRVMGTPEAERAAMGVRARARTEAEFSLKHVLDRWEALYRELLAARPEPARSGRRRETLAHSGGEAAYAESALAPEAVPATLAESE